MRTEGQYSSSCCRRRRRRRRRENMVVVVVFTTARLRIPRYVEKKMSVYCGVSFLSVIFLISGRGICIDASLIRDISVYINQNFNYAQATDSSDISPYNSVTSLKKVMCFFGIKGKVHPKTGHRGPEWEYRYSSTLSLTSALDGGGWLTPRSGSFTSG